MSSWLEFTGEEEPLFGAESEAGQIQIHKGWKVKCTRFHELLFYDSYYNVYATSPCLEMCSSDSLTCLEWGKPFDGGRAA